MTSLFEPLKLGDIGLANRLVMAPLTRDRAAPGRVPHALNALYYEQRADPATGAGLIISEGTQVSRWARATSTRRASTARSRSRAGGW